MAAVTLAFFRYKCYAAISRTPIVVIGVYYLVILLNRGEPATYTWRFGGILGREKRYSPSCLHWTYDRKQSCVCRGSFCRPCESFLDGSKDCWSDDTFIENQTYWCSWAKGSIYSSSSYNESILSSIYRDHAILASTGSCLVLVLLLFALPFFHQCCRIY
jgi:hypothetical protein